MKATLSSPIPGYGGEITPTHGMVEIYTSSMSYSDDLKALHVLRQNIQALLVWRKESASTLARFLGFKHRSSMTKFLKNERAGFQMDRLDRLAKFFGVPIYALFTPSVKGYGERRKGFERRTGRERRMGHQMRAAIDTKIIAAPPPPLPQPEAVRHQLDEVMLKLSELAAAFTKLESSEMPVRARRRRKNGA